MNWGVLLILMVAYVVAKVWLSQDPVDWMEQDDEALRRELAERRNPAHAGWVEMPVLHRARIEELKDALGPNAAYAEREDSSLAA